MKEILSILPGIESLKRLSQSLAMLDAIMSPDWEYRYYSFDSKWDDGEMLGSMKDGSGDSYLILFNSIGSIIKGFAHESSMSPYMNEPFGIWKGVLESVPDEFGDFLTEPAFSMDDTTFCTWRKFSDISWHIGDIDYPDGEDPDGMEDLLTILEGKPSSYREWAEDYFEKDIPIELIEHIYTCKPLTNELVSKLNSDISLEDLSTDIKEIGYPN